MEGTSSGDFGSTETRSLDQGDKEITAPSSNSALTIRENRTLESTLDAGSEHLREWATSRESIDSIMSDAAHWNAETPFFQKRDYKLHQALHLAYPVYVLLLYRHKETKALLRARYPLFEWRNGPFARNPALAALELVLKPIDEEQRKTCSEWAYKLLWASDESIMPEQVLQRIENISLSSAKASVRQRRRETNGRSKIAACAPEPSIRIVVTGDQGTKTFERFLEINHY